MEIIRNLKVLTTYLIFFLHFSPGFEISIVRDSFSLVDGQDDMVSDRVPNINGYYVSKMCNVNFINRWTICLDLR